MKARTLSLVLLAVCLVLLGLLFYALAELRGAREVVLLEREAQVITNTLLQRQIAVRKINASNLFAAMAKLPRSWSSIESTNYQTYLANMRAFGVPEETVRDIIIAEVARAYSARRAAVLSSTEYHFWQTGAGSGLAISDQTAAELQRLDEERAQLVQDLLGVDYRAEVALYQDDSGVLEEKMFAFLPSEKLSQLLAIREGYADLEASLRDQTGGVLLAEDQAQLRELQRQEREELAGLLSPEELEEYDLRFSPTASAMRQTLDGFPMSEEEFRKIFRLRKVFDDTFADALTADDPATRDARARAEGEARQELETELKGLLGEKRYQEYARVQDADYRQLLQLSQRLNAPASVASRVYDMRETAERQKQRVELNPNLSEDQRLRALAALAAETQRSLTEVMGGDLFRAYRAGGGEWLDGLWAPALAPLALPPAPPGLGVPPGP